MLKLKRAYLENCTIGTIYYQGSKVCNTIEKPWLSNIPFKSCIPVGLYDISRHHSEKYPNTFILENLNLGVGKNHGDSVRYGCLIHVANFHHEVQGCIGPGLQLHPNTWGVSGSRKAMDVLGKLINLESEDWEIEIV